jgi:hypothetical protein
MATTTLPGDAPDPVEHKGLSVTGYRAAQSPANVELVNRLKAHEEAACELLLEIAENIEAASAELGQDERNAAARALAIAKTDLEHGYMFAAKAVFRPQAGLYLLNFNRP